MSCETGEAAFWRISESELKSMTHFMQIEKP